MGNQEIAKLLRSISAAYEIRGNDKFRIVAYDRAATAVEQATSELKDLWDDKKLTTIPGIGQNIAGHLDEFFRTGKVRHFQRTMRGLPPAMFGFLDLPGIGPKTAFKLCQELKINRVAGSLKKLKEAAQAGKIRVIEGFAEQSEQAILEALKRQKPKKQRMLLPFASELTQRLIDYMKNEKTVLQVDSLGSLRRWAATVGDIDLAVATKQPKKVIAHFAKFPEVKKKIALGENTARVILDTGHQIDLKTQKPSAYGALLQHYTGSKQHNIHLREIAQGKGLSLSEYGIKKRGKIKAFKDENSFYGALAMDWIPPELRENTGEIEVAQQKRLPNLVKLSDIKGDLHLHSKFPIEPSHDEGLDSIKSMAEKAIELGYEYLGLSEHNPSISKHSQGQVVTIVKRKRERIDELNYSFNKSNQKDGLRLLNGLEIDIRPDGNLAIPEKALNLLDYAIGGVHNNLTMPRKRMTERILKGLEHPKIKILSHPTGRKLGQREGCEIEWDKVFAFCKKYNKYLEINAWPDRLDLPDSLVKDAVKNGVKMIINTDSHALKQMGLMIYGVSVARRGWAEKKDILNTLSWTKFNARLRERR